jgi:subtilisin family serine protease
MRALRFPGRGVARTRSVVHRVARAAVGSSLVLGAISGLACSDATTPIDHAAQVRADDGPAHPAAHREFAGRVVPAFTAIADSYGADGCHWHGTHVAGTVGGTTVGVAKAVTLYSVRVLDCSGVGSISDVIAGMDWVTANRVLPAVANMSVSAGYSSTLNAAVQNMINSGVTVVVAAGNASADACTYSPSSASSAVTVAASTEFDGQADFSNYGTCVDLYAPGTNVLSATNTTDTSLVTASGTSMATPHVTGAAALRAFR